MAITDDQLDELLDYARKLARDNILGVDPRADDVLDEVFAVAEKNDMRTEDEFDAIVTIDDLPASEDRQAIVNEYRLSPENIARRMGAVDVKGSQP
jgi:hypothetical protein